MRIEDEIRNWKGKPKELVSFLTKNVKDDKKLFAQLVECLKTGSDVEKGICGDVMKYVSRDNPEYVIPYVDTVIDYLNYRASKVKWVTAEVIGNITQRFPEEASKAVPKLLINTKDNGTVTRWSAAFALSEIVKYNSRIHKELVPQITEIIKKENNNGVKNVYLKALKSINK